MPLDITGILQLLETGEMPEKEYEPIVESSSLEKVKAEATTQEMVSTVLQEPDKPKEIPTSKLYKDLARAVKTGGDVSSEYSPEVIAQQLKEKTYPSKEVPTPVGAVLGAYATFGVALTKIPRAVAASVLQAAQGKEGASVVARDWADRYIRDASEDIKKFSEEASMRFGDKGFAGIKITDLAELPQNVGYSATSMLSGLAVGLPLNAVPLPGFRVAAWGAGTAASGAVAYRATTYQIMQQYLEIKNKESEIYNGRGLTQEEETRLKGGFDELAHKYGLWEAVPEALSNLAFVGLLTAPLTKMVGKTVAGQIVSKLGAMYGEELLTETITQMGQAGIETEVGMRIREKPIDWTSPKDWINSFKEVAPQTFLLTTLMAGAGTTVIGTAKAIKDIKRSLKKEIGIKHPLYDKFSKKLDEAKKPKVEGKVEYGEVPPPTTDKKVFDDTTKAVTALNELDATEQAVNRGEKPGKLLKTTGFDKLIAEAEAAVSKVKAEMPKPPPKKKVQRAINNERVKTCIRSMEASGKLPIDINEKVVRDVKLLQKIIGPINTYWAGNRIIENIAGILDRARPYGANWKIFTGDINAAENTKLEGNYSRVEALKDSLIQIYGKKDMVSALTRRRDIGKFSLSDEDIMFVYQGAFDKGVVKHLKVGNGFTDKDIKQCIAIVEGDSKMQAVLKWGAERYAEDHTLLAKVHMEATGEVLPKRPFYMHIAVDKKGATFEDDNVAKQMMQRDKVGIHAYVTKNITKPRVLSNKPVNLGYITNYLKYINEAEHYKAYVQPIKNLSALLRDPRYRVAVEKHLNYASLQALDKYVKDVSGTKTGADLSTMDKVASLLRRHTGLVLIGMNVLSGFRQTLSAFNAAAEVGPYWMVRGIEEVIKDPKGMQELIFSKSEQIKHRAGMWERFIAEEKQREKIAHVITGKMTPRKAFMAFASAFDKVTVLAAAVATYKRIMATGKLIDGERISNDDLETVAILEMDRVSRKTQPYVGAKDLPGWHRGSTIALMFTLFQNMANKVVNYVDYDIVYKTRVGVITPTRAAQKLLFAVVLPALMLGMIARGRFPKKEEAVLDVLRFPLYGMFITGSMINAVIEDYGEWQTPLLLGPQAFVRTGKAISKGEWEKAGRFGIQTAAYALGVPYNQPYRTYKGLLALINDETDDWRRLVWSDYALTKGK